MKCEVRGCPKEAETTWRGFAVCSRCFEELDALEGMRNGMKGMTFRIGSALFGLIVLLIGRWIFE